MQNRTHLMSLLLALTCFGTHCLAQPKNMIGRQSQNEGILVLPAPGKVTIDGDLTDWDFSADSSLVQLAAIAVDNDGHLVVADVGPDSQVKAYDAAGKCVYTCGRKGGRPIRGPFDPQAMARMSSVAVDAKGAVRVVENWNFPRRVGVWGRDGKLVRDYIGNTGYGGTGCYLHDQRPDLA